jgi:hypothetical protein
MNDLTRRYFELLDLTINETKNDQMIEQNFQNEVDLWRKESGVDPQYAPKLKYLISTILTSSESNQRILQLRWNFEEFEVHLNQINEMIPINNYYLKILIDETLQHKNFPFLTEERVREIFYIS